MNYLELHFHGDNDYIKNERNHMKKLYVFTPALALLFLGSFTFGSHHRVCAGNYWNCGSTPTPSESASPSPEQSPTTQPTSQDIPVFYAPIPDTVCKDTTPSTPKQVTVNDFKDGHMTVQWIPTGGSKATLVYQVPNGPQYSLIGTENDGIQTIDHLTSDRYYVKVQQHDSCAASEFSVEVLAQNQQTQQELQTLGTK